MQQLWSALSTLSLLQWTILAIIWLGTNVLIYGAFAKWIFRRQWRLYRNLKRPVIVLIPTMNSGQMIPGGEMKSEIQLLKTNKLLNIAEEPQEYRTFNPSEKHCVVVIGYKPGMEGLPDILSRVKSNHVPLIVYTYGNNAVGGSDKKLLDEYPYTLLANFPLTLLNQIFSTVASYPYDRK
ncbi:hypothetical protein TRIP_C20074 [Candidatus Zixiibacteriota bacterium]|nr:hypothetical protein TRIP_C20074 [candidate division Zixibacteria bacterium]